MLVYEKWVTETIDGVPTKVRHLYGTEGNVPSDSDNQLVYQDADGDTITPSLSNQYFDDGHGGIIMVSEEDDEKVETFVAVNIKKQDNSLVNIVPGGSYEPSDKVLKSIKFKTKPTKLEYAADATEVDPTGAVIEATWATGEKSVVANTDCTFTFEDTLAAGVDNNIVASYTYPASGASQVTKTAKCKITVVAAQVEEQNP